VLTLRREIVHGRPAAAGEAPAGCGIALFHMTSGAWRGTSSSIRCASKSAGMPLDASWCVPFGGIFGNPAAVPYYNPSARIIAFPGCPRGELAKLRHEIKEMNRVVRVGC
jgi:hypothetical protein